MLWIGAHPDDENCCAALLARAKAISGALSMLSLTQGENSDVLWGGLRRGSEIGEARAKLFAQSAAVLQADDTALGPFVNGPFGLQELDARPSTTPFQGWGPRTAPEDVIRKWAQDAGDPLEYIVRQMRSRRPDTIITMDDYCGLSGNPEHIAAGRLVRRAAVLAADSGSYPQSGKPWRVRHLIVSAKVIAPLVRCGYCKCQGPQPAEPAVRVNALEPSVLRQATYFGVACLVAKQYEDTMQEKGWSRSRMNDLCRQAQRNAFRLAASGTQEESVSEPYRIVSLSPP